AGTSRKGPEPGNASRYYAFTRLEASGELRLDGRTLAVDGSAWLDREWGTSALGAGVAGWDWFALQLDDGRDLMLYRLRRADGSSDPYSAGSLVAADGTPTPLAADAFSIEVLQQRDSRLGTRYPSRWRLRVPRAGLDLQVSPLLDEQELALSVRYWEGAVVASGSVGGRGYAELTGYAGASGPGRR
ncbi:MAG TPA: lipocalin family protein, partial [Gammaproteobacteria bacterium]